MKLSTKILSTSALLALTSPLFAANVTVPSTPGGEVVVTAPDSTQFVQTGFTYPVSAGVYVNAMQNAVKFVANANHAKGRFTYSGDSSGGSVTPCQATAAEEGFTAQAPIAIDDACGGLS